MLNTLWKCTWKFIQATPEEVFLKISLISVLVVVHKHEARDVHCSAS